MRVNELFGQIEGHRHSSIANVLVSRLEPAGSLGGSLTFTLFRSNWLSRITRARRAVDFLMRPIGSSYLTKQRHASGSWNRRLARYKPEGPCLASAFPSSAAAHVFVGLKLDDAHTERAGVVEELQRHGYQVIDFSADETAKLHVSCDSSSRNGPAR
jgi:hypothetical protein